MTYKGRKMKPPIYHHIGGLEKLRDELTSAGVIYHHIGGLESKTCYLCKSKRIYHHIGGLEN